MDNQITILETYDIPTSSPVAAIQFINERDELSDELYLHRIRELCEDETLDVKVENSIPLRFVYLYLVQNIVKANGSDSDATVNELLTKSEEEATVYVHKNPWAVIRSSEEDDADDMTTSRRKPKKQNKQERAFDLYKQMKDSSSRADIIAVFIEQLELSKAGANTYFYNCKKEFGDVANKSEKKEKKKGKYEASYELFKANPNMSKKEYIDLFVAKLNTSEAGANTYYYAAKKRIAAE